MKRQILVVLILVALVLSACSTGNNANWPSKKVDIQIAYTAGGTADTANRQLAVLMSESLGTTFNLVNVTGGSGSIAGSHTAAEDFRYGGGDSVNRNIR